MDPGLNSPVSLQSKQNDPGGVGPGWLSTIATSRLGWRLFQDMEGSMASCLRNIQLYSSHPDPPCRNASLIMSLE